MAAMSNRFWEIGSPVEPRFFADFVRQPDFEVIRCTEPSHEAWSGRRLSPLSLKLGAPALNDFVWSWFYDVVINDRILEILLNHGDSGFETRPAPARARRKRDPAVPPLHELIVTGWAGLAAPESGLYVKEACPKCHFRSYGIERPDRLIKSTTWDGSDFFMVWPLPQWKFVSERLAEILRRERATGIKLRPAEEITIPHSLGPEGMNCHMPEARARELGEPLGIYW